MIEDIVNNNGFEYVDLGLPSRTLWAMMNIGASKPSDPGLYFQWGDTKGYTADQIEYKNGKDKQFTWKDYKWNPSGDEKTYTKYTNPGDKLKSEDDAAHINIGEDWHIPTPEQIQELFANTISSWETLDGMNGRLFISKKNAKSIFIPASGIAWFRTVELIGNIGSVWSSMLDTNNTRKAFLLDFGTAGICLSYGDRADGHSIRGVKYGK